MLAVAICELFHSTDFCSFVDSKIFYGEHESPL